MPSSRASQRDDLAKGQLVWVETVTGNRPFTTALIKREGNLWVVDSFVYVRVSRVLASRAWTRTAWVWCKSLTSGRLHDFHETELTLHQPDQLTPNEEGVTDQ